MIAVFYVPPVRRNGKSFTGEVICSVYPLDNVPAVTNAEQIAALLNGRACTDYTVPAAVQCLLGLHVVVTSGQAGPYVIESIGAPAGCEAARDNRHVEVRGLFGVRGIRWVSAKDIVIGQPPRPNLELRMLRELRNVAREAFTFGMLDTSHAPTRGLHAALGNALDAVPPERE